MSVEAVPPGGYRPARGVVTSLNEDGGLGVEFHNGLKVRAGRSSNSAVGPLTGMVVRWCRHHRFGAAMCHCARCARCTLMPFTDAGSVLKCEMWLLLLLRRRRRRRRSGGGKLVSVCTDRVVVHTRRYFLSPFVFTVFGTPLLLKVVPEHTSALTLYQAVWSESSRFIRRSSRHGAPSEPVVGAAAVPPAEGAVVAAPPAAAAAAPAAAPSSSASPSADADGECGAGGRTARFVCGFTSVLAAVGMSTPPVAPDAPAVPASAADIAATWGFVLRRAGRDCLSCAVCSSLQVRAPVCVVWAPLQRCLVFCRARARSIAWAASLTRRPLRSFATTLKRLLSTGTRWCWKRGEFGAARASIGRRDT